jgi:hypothetical protein
MKLRTFYDTFGQGCRGEAPLLLKRAGFLNLTSYFPKSSWQDPGICCESVFAGLLKKSTSTRRLDGKVLTENLGNRQNGRFPTLPPEVAQTVKSESYSFSVTITDCMKQKHRSQARTLLSQGSESGWQEMLLQLYEASSNLSLRKQQNSSTTRAESFRNETANYFSDIRDENLLHATRIYNR